MKRPEQDLQISVCKWLDWCLPKPWRYWATYNNAKNRTQGGINKAMGVKAGFPDLCVAGRLNGGTCLVGIELKVGARKLEDAQQDWRRWFFESGASYFLCRSIDDVEDALRTAGVPLRAPGEG